MISPVIIKGNKMGIKLIIPTEAVLDDVIAELKRKLQNTGHYYRSIKPISVTFEGKYLTYDETEQVIDTLRNIGLNIKQNHFSDTTKKEEITSNLLSDKDGLFYVGSLGSGQTINATGSIVIVGDIKQGASVFSEGNIIITGSLEGYAEAGCRGRKDAFVYSFINGRNSE
jgi:septum site-determining protein MinC